jgi:potassium efflux system protein
LLLHTGPESEYHAGLSVPRTSSRLVHLLLIACLALIVCHAPAARAQADDATPAEEADTTASTPRTLAMPEEVTTEWIRGAIASIEDGLILGLTDEEKTAAIDALSKSLDNLASSATFEGQARELNTAAAQATDRAEQVRSQLAEALPPAESVIPQGVTSKEFESFMAEARAELQRANEEVTTLETESTRRAARVESIPVLLAELRERLGQVDVEAESPRPSEEARSLGVATRVRFQTESRAIRQQIDALESELASYNARGDLLRLRISQARRRAEQAERVVDAAVAAQATVREAEAQRASEGAARLAERTRAFAEDLPVVTEIIDHNNSVAERLSDPEGVRTQLADAERALAGLDEYLRGLRARSARTREKIEAAGQTEAAGLLLRSEYQALPERAELRRRFRVTTDQLSRAQYAELDLEDRIEELTPPPLSEVMEEVPEDIPVPRDEVERIVSELLTQLADNLRTLENLHQAYFSTLLKVQTRSRELSSEIDAYREYIIERILWVPSVERGRLWDFQTMGQAFAWSYNPVTWGRLVIAGVAEATKRPWTIALPVGGILFGLLLRRRALARLRAAAAIAGDPTRDNVGTTTAAIGATFILTLPVPSMLWLLAVLAELVGSSANVDVVLSEFGEATQMGLARAVIYFIFGCGMMEICRPDGLGPAHFRWPTAACAAIRRHTWWLLLVILVLGSGLHAMRTLEDTAYISSGGRLLFIAGMIAIAVYIILLLRPSGPVMASHRRRYPFGWVTRARWAWFLFLLAIPITLITLSLARYALTAYVLNRRLLISVALLVGVMVLAALLKRLVRASRRRASALGTAPSTLRGRQSRRSMQLQARQLLRGGVVVLTVIVLYSVWADTAPALRVLDRVTVWPSFSVIEEGDEPPPAPTPTPPTGEQSGSSSTPTLTPGMPLQTSVSSSTEPRADARAVRVSDVISALAIALITIVASRNLPAMAEILVIGRLPLDSGGRFAMRTLLRYFILIFGISLTFSAIGIGWSTIQWLAAALTFGLAFGLQEIFANFVSGLIILFERPVRVGDVVTVGDVTGTVTEIRMRAATVTDWDRKELIIPNKSFITDRVINWTLSDPTLRVTIPIGVQFGSDTETVNRVLHSCARASPFVLRKPAHLVVFRGFGEHMLKFDVRVYIASIDDLLKAQHDVCMRLEKALRDEGIQVAIPQRGVMLDTAGGAINVRLARGDDDVTN